MTPPAKASAHLLMATGTTALAGSLALILGNIIGGIVVPGHDWVADTVSDLAAGPYEIIQDFALYGYAAALMACAIGAAHHHTDGTRWNIGILCLALLAAIVVVIGARNEYGDSDRDGIVIHSYLVYALGFLFAVLFVVMARGMALIGNGYAKVTRLCAVLWILGAPVFFILPTEYDGAYERGLGVITLLWVTTFASMMISVARRIG
ncbi:DUF998 domain-containing protein [Marivita sp. GX14005]|uniref:DUF998 domain-containing protein n=1 Tax=Marivita sp. GX14005 TaxID=2942276 RepID=UPI0020184BE4|nr:DUF998 domain-containing protein [Marivita sp. GX14005]MCL3881455.1 DUF998 domain-containing protein [Marivita sp. GX14005]